MNRNFGERSNNMIIEQQPDTLTLCGNLKDFIVSGVSTLSFILSDSGQTLINEVYESGADGKIRIRIKDIIKDTLKVLIPSYDSDVYPQPEATRTFIADLGGEQIIFTVIKGGIHSSSASIISFLRQNFLSWQPQIKHIIARQPEWLSYYAEDDCDLKLKAYFEDKTEEIKTINLAGGRITMVNLHYDKVNNYFEKNVGYYDVWVEKAGQRMTYIQRYIPIPEPDTCELYVFENSVGGVDSFMCTGEHSLKPQTESTLGVVYSNTSEITNDFSLVYKQNTGFVPNLEYAKWLMDFFSSQQRYHVTEEGLRQIYMEDSDNEFKNSELNSFEFEFRYTDQTVYNRVVRNYDFLPKLLEFPQDGELFFLTPRLSEYPFTTYSDDLILPVQHPYSGKWYHLPAFLFKPERVDVNISDATYTNKGIASFSEKYFSVENGHISLKEEILSATACDFSKYFYEKEGQLYCKLDLIGEKGVSAYGLGPDGSSGTGWDLIDELTSTRTDAGLTANMGRYLKSLIDGKASSWDTITGKPDFSKVKVDNSFAADRLVNKINGLNTSDCNTINGGGTIYNYASASYWRNAPSGMNYGSVFQLNSIESNALALQLAADVNHNVSDSTRGLWFRTANNLGFQNDWKEVFHSGNANLTSVSWSASLINFPEMQFNVNAAPRTTLPPMSIKLWDSYNQSIGTGTTYATVLQIYGKVGHWDNQIAFDGFNGSIYYRNASYNSSAYCAWRKLWDSDNHGPNSGLNADLLDGYHRHNLYNGLSDFAMTVGNVKSIIVDGDRNTYYPVVITGLDGKYVNNIISITKNLDSQTPDWPNNHGNGTSSCLYRYDFRYMGWDGNGGFIRTLNAWYGYATVCAHTSYSHKTNGGLIIWLRGGGAQYYISCANRFNVNIYYSRMNLGNETYPDFVEPRTTIGNAGRIATHSFPVWSELEGVSGIRFTGTGHYRINEYGNFQATSGSTSNSWNVCNTSGSSVLHVNADLGRIGIGTTSPSFKLDVQGDICTSAWLRCTGNGGWYNNTHDGGIYMNDSTYVKLFNNKVFYNDGYRVFGIGGHNVGLKLYQAYHIGLNLANNSYTWGIYSNSDGNLYIGRRNGDVNDSSGSYYYILGAGMFTVKGNINATGEITAYSASDRRLKENISPLIGRASDILKRLNPVEFDWNDTAMKLNPAKHRHDYSFLADEYGEVFPYAVSTIYEKYQAIDTKILLPLLVAGFKELDKRLNNLEQIK